jgi:hypothetical protein
MPVPAHWIWAAPPQDGADFRIPRDGCTHKSFADCGGQFPAPCLECQNQRGPEVPTRLLGIPKNAPGKAKRAKILSISDLGSQLLVDAERLEVPCPGFAWLSPEPGTETRGIRAMACESFRRNVQCRAVVVTTTLVVTAQ